MVTLRDIVLIGALSSVSLSSSMAGCAREPLNCLVDHAEISLRILKKQTENLAQENLQNFVVNIPSFWKDNYTQCVLNGLRADLGAYYDISIENINGIKSYLITLKDPERLPQKT